MIAAQRAEAEPPQAARSSVPRTPDQRDDLALRERLIGLAQQAAVNADGTLTPEEVVRRASTYLDFVQGGPDGRAG